MISNGNVFVAALSRRFCHRLNIAGAITPMRVHLQIAVKAGPPRSGGGKQGATFGQSEKFFAQRWRTGRMLSLPNPLPNLFLQEPTDVRQFGERALLRHQIACLDFPEESAAR